MGFLSHPRGHGWHEDLWCRRLVSGRVVGALGVVVATPALDDKLRLGERAEDYPIEQFVSHSRWTSSMGVDHKISRELVEPELMMAQCTSRGTDIGGVTTSMPTPLSEDSAWRPEPGPALS
jgi:hypothetical protein